MNARDPIAELRRAFDEAFARPPSTSIEQAEGVLLVRAGASALALRASQIRSIRLCPEIAGLPAAAPAVLGVATIRGVVAGVYDLAELAGGTRGKARWLVLCGDGTAGLAFDELTGHERVPVAKLQGEQTAIQFAGVAHVLIDVAALIERITKQGENA